VRRTPSVPLSVICVSSVRSPARACWHMRENGRVTSATRQPGTPSAAVRPRLIATDLDGTLLRDDKSVSPRTVAALAAAEEAGIEVFFVHRFVKVRELARANALDAVRLLREAAPGTVFAVEQTYGFHQEPDYPKLHLEIPDNLQPAERLLAPDGPDADQPVLKILAYHPDLDPDAFLTLARIAIGDRANVTRSSPSALLELSGPDVSKASTLALCCAERGIAHDEVVAFGDMPNDVEMLTWAGRSYAMGNAHPDVVAAASGRTVANNEDGVAVVIEQLLADRF
jgi:hydroxymethylpyrimidine pyrophosphatase-like HAD family hydrolase